MNMEPTQNLAYAHRMEILRRLRNVKDVAALTPEERWDYEADLKMARDYNAELKGAWYLGWEEGRAKAYAEAVAKGEAKER